MYKPIRVDEEKEKKQNEGYTATSSGTSKAVQADTAPARSAQTQSKAAQTGVGMKTVTAPGTYTYEPYQQSDAVAKAEAMLQEHMQQKPGSYQSQWSEQISDIINRILNREDFSYDMNKDALYHQYADQYMRQGQQAMMDAMGQAAAMTGGYTSSYGQTVGQQTYQGYLQQLGDIVPELYQLALDQYNREGEEMYNQYGLLSDQENTDYSRYQDAYANWLAERDYYAGRYDSERDFDYGLYADERNFGYQKYRDDVSDRQWQKTFNEQYGDTSSGGSTSSGSDSGAGGYEAPDGWDEADIMEFQKKCNLEEDGIWGPQTKAAYEKYGPDGPSASTKGWFDYDEQTHEEIVEENGGSYYKETLNTLKIMKNQGRSDADVKKFLEEALGNGYLSRSEYLTLYNKYRDGKL